MTSSVPKRTPTVAMIDPGQALSIAPDDDTRRALERWHAGHGDLYCVPDAGGARPHWVVHDPALVQQVLVRHAANYTKGAGLDRVRILLGNGIMVSEGDFWARQRRLLQPAFRPRALADFDTMIVAENQRLAERWLAMAADGATIDVAAQVSELILVIALKSIFGADYPRLMAAGDNPFALLTEVPERNLRFAARFHRLKEVVERIVETRLEAPRKEFDFLGHMLVARTRAGAGMSRRALLDEVMTLIVAGHETTASALAWAWYLIATHPQARAALQAEVDTVDEAMPGIGSQALAFTDQVINETLRLYPPGWLLSRRAIATDRLGAHEIPAGAQIFISPYILHRHEAYWSTVDCFDPTRFAHGQPSHRFAYLPFAAGPRHCIGEHLAMTEMRVHLAVMLRRFTPRFVGAGPPVLESHINLRPRDGIYLQLAPR